ncbi:MAG: hypothetical protein HC933_15685 [Pleurocapsa sp. SU_196_0]|nr:hypothetical protein [Pleurocapsa sp. SU_196_0]
MNRATGIFAVLCLGTIITACNTAVPTAKTSLIPCEQLALQGEATTARLPDDPCNPPPPPPPPAPPAAPTFQPLANLNARAEALGISREAAAFSDVEDTLARAKGLTTTAVAGGRVRTQAYPLNATSRTDFVQKLFANAVWVLPPVGVTPTGGTVQDPNCSRTPVSETYRPDKLVAFGLGEDKFYPGSLIQGRWVNLGGPSLLPISLSASKRKPITVFSPQWNLTQTTTDPTASGVTLAIGTMRDAARARFPSGVPSVAFLSEVKTASSLEEAMVKFGYDASVSISGLTGSAKQSAEALRTSSSNTVFIQAIEMTYQIAIDLKGERPENGLPSEFDHRERLRAVGRER